MSNIHHTLSSLKKGSIPKTPMLGFYFSLGSELLLVLYLFFFFLWTAEIILPGFISLRINLAPYFALLLGATFFLMYLGQMAKYEFPRTFRFEKPLLILATFWGLGILTISLIKFPWWAILLLVISFVAMVYYFWKTLLQNNS